MPTANGWAIYFHPAFKGKFDPLISQVEHLKATLEPAAYAAHPQVKLLERLRSILFDEVPSDPAAAAYELGNTLGPTYRHWRRAKFLGRFRLFFRFSSKQRAIVYAWVNDERSLRKEGAKTDAYYAFGKRLRAGDPPDDWTDLFSQAAE